MDRLQLLDDVLRRVADQQSAAALDRASGDADESVMFTGAVFAFLAFMNSRHAEATRWARAAVAAESDDLADRLLAAAALALAAASDPTVDDEAALEPLLAAAHDVDPSCRVGAVGRHLATEAALACARIDLAVELDGIGHRPEVLWAEHPYGGVMVACAARTATFGGDVDGALARLASTERRGLTGHLLNATHALAAGNAADVSTMEALIAEVEAADVPAVDRIGRGIHLLLAFGVVALGDTRSAVRHLLRAGGGADLENLTLIDRALGYELLAAAAVAEEDRDAAEAWEQRALPLADHRIAAPCLSRIRSRVALLAGDTAVAEAHAARAVELARADGRTVEHAEAEIVLARARIAAGNVSAATRSLRTAVRTGDRTGHHAVRHAATRELRPARRRLSPANGTGWQSLSDRERQVVTLIARGADTEAIATELHLSVATVRAHTSRVLTAYGVATRTALLARLFEPPVRPVRPGDLTPRQVEVAELVAVGSSNAEIAGRLGVSLKSAEKHVSDILRRWEASSRFALAHRWWMVQATAGSDPERAGLTAPNPY